MVYYFLDHVRYIGVVVYCFKSSEHIEFYINIHIYMA